MKTQTPTTAPTQFKAELWTTVSGPGGAREVWATITLTAIRIHEQLVNGTSN